MTTAPDLLTTPETAAWQRHQRAVMAVGSGIGMSLAQARELLDSYAAWVCLFLDGASASELIVAQRERVARFMRARIVE